MEELKIIAEALNVANLKGAFNMQESAKIMECLNALNKKLTEVKEIKQV